MSNTSCQICQIATFTENNARLNLGTDNEIFFHASKALPFDHYWF